MVYEIYFEPKGAVWRLRITTFLFGFFSRSAVVQKREEGAATCIPMDFPTFDDALRYTARVGLDKAYQRRIRLTDAETQINGVLVHGSSAS